MERTLTALEPGSYTVDVDLPGVAVKVSPRKLNFTKSGQERKFKVTFQNVNAPLDEFAMGELVFDGRGQARQTGRAAAGASTSCISHRGPAGHGRGPGQHGLYFRRR